MRFSALGDSAIVAELGETISPETLQRVRNFASAVKRAHLPGVVDIVPAFASVTVFYDLAKWASASVETPHIQLSRELEKIAEHLAASETPVSGGTGKEIVVPTCYGGGFGPDLIAVAERAGLTVEEVIALHSEPSYLVHAIGFAPGFPYLGGLPERLHTPRRATPRVSVPAGSVGIGGAQTGIYPLATPGGWQLIGRTPLRLFDPARAAPALLRVGDRVRFQPIAPEKFVAPAVEAPPKKSGSPDDRSPQLRVLRPGMLTTVQDLGRRGHRADGVPLSGAADAVALRIANWLVGNSEEAAVLEFTLVGPELELTSDTVVALGGADFGVLPRWQPIRVAAGTRLKFEAAREGCRGYLAVAGGFEIASVLGSASTCLRAGFGGVEGRALREGDVLRISAQSRRVDGHWRIDERILPRYSPSPTIRIVRGAQERDFFEMLLTQEFAVTPRSDRMGLRLSGRRSSEQPTVELLSSAVVPGTIQVPPDGQPIVLMTDAQTIGGYPQAAHVITVDLPIVGQLRPGDRVRFCEVSLTEAQKLFFAREHALAILHEGLVQKFS